MNRYPTNSPEADALLAVTENDHDTAREIIATMLPGERRRLAEHAHKLADLLGEHARIAAAASGWCGFGNRGSTCRHDATGYFMYRGVPTGVCQCHRAEATELGYDVHEPPGR